MDAADYLQRRVDNDRQLVERIAARDRAAFREFYDRYQKRIFVFIRRRIASLALSEDLLHEVMLEVWNGARSFNRRTRVETWVLTIANRRVLAALRQTPPPDRPAVPKPKRRLTATGDLVEIDQGAQSSAEDVVAGNAAILRLTEAQRLTLHLIFYQSLRYDDAAEILDCSQDAVKALLDEAKNALRESFRRPSGAGSLVL